MLRATMEQVKDGLFWFLAFLFSTTVHEAMHAFIALRGGDSTAYRGGQVSLSPIPHIRREPIGMLLVPLITAFTQGWAIGWASAPFDPAWAERYPRRAALMSAAGPLGNFSIALVAWVGLRVGLGVGYFEAPDMIVYSHLVVPASGDLHGLGAFLSEGLSVLVILNVFLGVFNLLPLPPLDGASAVLGLLPTDLAERAAVVMRNSGFSLLGLIVAWQVFPLITPGLFRAVARSLSLIE
jgi:Zn-dependent protease